MTVPDVPSNSHANKEGLPSRPEIRKIIDGEAVRKKNGFGARVKNAFIADSLDVVSDQVFKEVILPKSRQMIFDTITAVADRMFLGGNAAPVSRGNHGRTVYRRDSGGSRYRDQRGPVQQPFAAAPQGGRYSYVIPTHGEVSRVVDTMAEVCRIDGYVRAGDFLELIGQPHTPQDWSWGWTSMVGVRIRQVNDGWVIDFPPEEPIFREMR